MKINKQYGQISTFLNTSEENSQKTLYSTYVGFRILKIWQILWCFARLFHKQSINLLFTNKSIVYYSYNNNNNISCLC